MNIEEQIRRLVIDCFKVSEDALVVKSREAEYVYARKAFVYLLKKNTELTLSQIGIRIGGRGHAAVIHLLRSANDFIDVDKLFKSNIDYIQSRLNVEEKKPSEIIKLVMDSIVWKEKGTTRRNLENLFVN